MDAALTEMEFAFSNHFEEALPRTIRVTIGEWDEEDWAAVEVKFLQLGPLGDLAFPMSWHKQDLENLKRQLEKFLSNGESIDFEPMEPAISLRVESMGELARMELLVDLTFLDGGTATGTGIAAVIMVDRKAVERALALENV